MGETNLFASVIPALFTALGTAKQYEGYTNAAAAARSAGQAKAAADQFAAEQLEQRAGQQIAASQRQRDEVGLETDLTLSHAKAMAAASGAGATDPTVVRLMANLAGRGAYKANIALYQGEEAARALRMQASADTYQASLDIMAGNQKGDAYDTQAESSLISGAGNLFSKYGMASTKSGDGLTSPTGGGQNDAWAQGGYGT